MRNPRIAMVRYVQPKSCLMILQVSLKLQHRSTRNFTTIFAQRKCVRRCSIVTSYHIQDGGRPPFWRSLNHHISVKNHPILIKFGTLQKILNPMTVTWPNIEIFNKIQDGGGRHLENRFFGHNSSTDCPISAKFCMRKQNGMLTRATWQKLQFFLNLRWQTAVILKIVKSPYLSEKLSDVDEIRYTTANDEPDYSHVTRNCNFWNSRWRRPPTWKSWYHHISVKLLLDFDTSWCTTAYIKPNRFLKALSQYFRCGKYVIR